MSIIAVLTGDIVHSRKLADKADWLQRLKEVFRYLEEMQDTGKYGLCWEIFRGDSFQAAWQAPEQVLFAALLIRTGLRSLPQFFEQGLDVRIGIGIGHEGFKATSVKESDGEAYQLSGQMLDLLDKDKQRLAIRSGWEDLNKMLEASLPLVEAIMQDWSQPLHEIAFYRLRYPDMTQQALAEKLSITQPSINWRLNKSRIDLILAYENFFRNRVKELHEHREP